MAANYQILLDSPAQTHLAIGFGALADAFCDVIQKSEPRFAVGLFGGWGSGKTTLMQAIEDRVDTTRCAPVWFSAWRYQKEEHLIVPLLDVVREGLIEWAEKNRGISGDLADMAERVAGTVGKAIYSLIAGFSLKAGIPDGPSVSFDANKALAKAEQFDAARAAAHVPRSFYHASFVALEDAFREFTGPNQERRIIVFVDDLDRCLGEGALEVLESMKLFFDLSGFVFVVGLDRRAIEMSVEKRYRALLPESGESDAQIIGAQYLRKIFQVPYTIAPVSTAQIDDFLDATQLSSKLPNEQWDEIQKLVKPHLRYLVSEGGVNPREIKRYINAYTLVRKTRPWLDKSVMLALQTIANRPDWSAVQLTLLAFRGVFLDALRRHLDEPDRRHLENLNPDLASLPQSFMDYMGEADAGRPLYEYSGAIDEFIYGGEATRSSEGTEFIDLFQEIAGLIEAVRRSTNGSDGAIMELRRLATEAISSYERIRGKGADNVTIELMDLANCEGILKGMTQPHEADGPGSAEYERLEERVQKIERELIEKVRRALGHLLERYQAGAI